MTKNSYLITPTLLNSFFYFINYDEEAQRDKYESSNFIPKSNEEIRQEFLQTLSREKFKPTPRMQDGIDFEDMIRGDQVILIDWEDGVETIQEIVKDGLWQVTVQKPLTINDTKYLLYGKCDVMKDDIIYDIKFTNSYEVGKFFGSAQHRIYLYCSGLPQFSYLISNGREYWKEDYSNHSKIEDEIKQMIADFNCYLEQDQEAKALFTEKWRSN